MLNGAKEYTMPCLMWTMASRFNILFLFCYLTFLMFFYDLFLYLFLKIYFHIKLSDSFLLLLLFFFLNIFYLCITQFIIYTNFCWIFYIISVFGKYLTNLYFSSSNHILYFWFLVTILFYKIIEKVETLLGPLLS